MKTLTAAERRALRAKAHSLSPVVAIGQHGLTPSVLHEIDVALLAHELIKIRVFNDDRDERNALFDRICGELDAAAVQHIGKQLVVWRPAPPPEPPPARPASRPRPNAPVKRAKPARKKPTGNARTSVTAGMAKRTPRTPSAAPATRRRRDTARGPAASAFDAIPGTRRRPRDGETTDRRSGPQPKAKSYAPRDSAAGGGRTTGARPPRSGAMSGKTGGKRPPRPHGKSASSTIGASGARRRRRAG